MLDQEKLTQERCMEQGAEPDSLRALMESPEQPREHFSVQSLESGHSSVQPPKPEGIQQEEILIGPSLLPLLEPDSVQLRGSGHSSLQSPEPEREQTTANVGPFLSPSLQPDSAQHQTEMMRSQGRDVTMTASTSRVPQQRHPRVQALGPVALEQWRRHFLNDHMPARRDCAQCVRAQAKSKPHRRIQHPDAYTLSMDLSGKLSPAKDVTVRQLTFVQPVKSRAVKHLMPALARVYARIRALGLPVYRLHSDRAREFSSNETQAWAAERNILATITSGSSFKANGRVENEVGVIKKSIHILISSGTCLLSQWHLAARHLGERRLHSQLNILGWPVGRLLKFGAKAYALRKTWQARYAPSRDSREEVIVLGPDVYASLTNTGYYVKSVTTGRCFYIRMTSSFLMLNKKLWKTKCFIFLNGNLMNLHDVIVKKLRYQPFR
eukprot:s3762_g7.t1